MTREIFTGAKNLSSYFLDSRQKPRDQKSPRVAALLLRVRFEPTIPKLLVKVSSRDAGRNLSIPNLGEVLLRSNGNERIAVINVSSNVDAGDIVMSLKLAEMLKAVEGTTIEVSPAPIVGRKTQLPSVSRENCAPRPQQPAKTRESTKLRSMLTEALSAESRAASTSARGIPPEPSFSKNYLEARGKNGVLPKPAVFQVHETSPSLGERYNNQTRSSGSSSTVTHSLDFSAGRPGVTSRPTAQYSEARPRYYTTQTPPSWFTPIPSSRSDFSASGNPYMHSDNRYDTHLDKPQRPTCKSSTATPESFPSPTTDDERDLSNYEKSRSWQRVFADRLKQKMVDLSGSESSEDEEPDILKPRSYDSYYRSSLPSRFERTEHDGVENMANYFDPASHRLRRSDSSEIYESSDSSDDLRSPILVPSPCGPKSAAFRTFARAHAKTSRPCAKSSYPSYPSSTFRCYESRAPCLEVPTEGRSSSSTSSPAASITSNKPLSTPDFSPPETPTERKNYSTMPPPRFESKHPPSHGSKPLPGTPPGPGPPRLTSRELVPYTGNDGEDKKSNRKRSKDVNLGAVQVEEVVLSPMPRKRSKLPSTVRPPKKHAGSFYSDSHLCEQSDLGPGVSQSLTKWLHGEISGRHVAHLISDRCQASTSNFRSGFGSTIIGGPLGVFVGGQIEGCTLYEDIFRFPPEIAIRDAFQHFGFQASDTGNRNFSITTENHDWSHISTDELTLAYRRISLKTHPNRGGCTKLYNKTQAYIEILRAFTSRTANEQKPVAGVDDNDIIKEMLRSWTEVEEDAKRMSLDELRRCNKFFDDYILRQMRFKSEVIDEMARLHENAAYAILGVDALASDEEIKKAYKLTAMSCHPDKGGDKEDFQELTNAYEKIMGQRKGETKRENDPEDRPEDRPTRPFGSTEEEPRKKSEAPEPKEKGGEDDEESESQDEEKSDSHEDGSDATQPSPQSVLEKVSKSAEEASRFANTAADFAQQVTEASKTARSAADSEIVTRKGEFRLTRTISHSAIVLTLTVVKAVRVVGYAALDSAAHALHISKRLSTTPQCAAAAANAMAAGFDALNAASTCAQSTEAAASELQSALQQKNTMDPNRMADAAAKAAVAAALAAHSAIAAAISASEASKHTAKVVHEWTMRNEKEKAARKGQKQEKRREKSEKKNSEDDKENSEGEKEASPESSPREESKNTESEKPEREEDRALAQRVNNHKLLQRLNAEILGYQTNMKTFLTSNSLLIPEVSKAKKTDVFAVLADYIADAQAQMRKASSHGLSFDEIFATLLREPPLATYMLTSPLAIPINVDSRVLKTAQLLDCKLLWKSISNGIFDFIDQLFSNVPPRVGRIKNKVRDSILSFFEEEKEQKI